MSTEGVSGVTSSIFSLMKEEEMKHCKCLLTTTTSAHDNGKKSSKLSSALLLSKGVRIQIIFFCLK